MRALVPTLVGITTLVAVVSSLGAPLIPTISADNGVSLSTGQWLLTAALLTGALATPIMGRLSDGPLQRHVVTVALAVVLVGSVVAAASSSFSVLVWGRALQGLGLGLLPVTMAIARTHLNTEKAGRTIATLSITAAVGVGLGYPLTGLVSDVWNYHVAFWFGAAFVLVALVVSLLVIPSSRTLPRRRFDGFGALTLSLALIALLVALSQGDEWGWHSTRVIACFVASALLGAVWVAIELKVHDPLVDLRQVRNRSVLTADVSGFMISLSMYLFMPVIVEFVQLPTSTGFGFGASVVQAGLMLVPLSIGTLVSSRCTPAFSRAFGTRVMIPFGSLIFAAASLSFTIWHSAMWQAYISVGLVGIGLGFTFAAMPGFIVRAVPASETGSATGFYQVLRSVGLSIGSAVSAVVLSSFTPDGQEIPTVTGFTTALHIAAGLCFLTAIVSYVLPGRMGPSAELGEKARQRLDEFAEESGEVAGSGAMLADEAFVLEGD